MIKRIKIGTASCGIAAGALEVLDYFKKNVVDIEVVEVGCIGHCYAEPLVEIETSNGESIIFKEVKPNKKDFDNIIS